MRKIIRIEQGVFYDVEYVAYSNQELETTEDIAYAYVFTDKVELDTIVSDLRYAGWNATVEDVP